MSFSDLSNQSIGFGGVTVGDLFSAILTLLICLAVIWLLSRLFTRLLKKTSLDRRIQKYIVRGIKFIAYIITAILVIESLGVKATSLVALLSIGSLGITLAAEDVLGNMAGGLVILSSRPFAIGDLVEASGIIGTVEEIALIHTKLITPEGTMVMIPNKLLSDSKLINYTVLGRRRVTQKVTASYDAPTDTVKDACQKALHATSGLLETPAPSIHLTSYGASSIEYTVFCWCKPEDYWNVYYALGENLRGAFDTCRVEMTYDHLNVHIVEDSAAGKGR